MSLPETDMPRADRLYFDILGYIDHGQVVFVKRNTCFLKG